MRLAALDVTDTALSDCIAVFVWEMVFVHPLYQHSTTTDEVLGNVWDLQHKDAERQLSDEFKDSQLLQCYCS